MNRKHISMSVPDMRDERGLALIHVGIAIFVLIAMSAFVLDFGVMWMARRQAQNAADAGALAGAIARAYDETADPPAADGLAYKSAVAAAQLNEVFNEAGGVRVTWDCPDYAPVGRCVRVDVFRDGTDIDADGTTDSNQLPVFFAKLFGLSGQKVRATATAWVGSGNSVNCMRPFGVADRWEDNVDLDGDATDPVAFEHWDNDGPNAVEITPDFDVYTPPSPGSEGTGYTVADHLGAQVVLKGGNNPNSVADAISPGWTLPLQLPDGEGGYESGASTYSNAIKHCIGNPVTIGDYLPTETGVMVGPTAQGTETDGDSLINQDPDAEWDEESETITGSCAPACAEFSPRIVPIAIFDMDEFQWRSTANDWTTNWIPGEGPGTGTFSCPIGGRCVRVVNIIGFFVERMEGQDVFGRVIKYPGDFATGNTSVNNDAAFITAIQLIR
jgi:Flp pilus assembly protein TadG